MNNKALLSDSNKKNNIVVTIRGKSNLKMCMGDLCAYIPIQELYQLLLVVTNEEQRANMLSFKKREMMKFIRQHTVVAQKDIKKGEHLVVNCEVNVPKMVIDNIINKEKGRSTK